MLKLLSLFVPVLFSSISFAIDKHASFEQSAINYLSDEKHSIVEVFKNLKTTLSVLSFRKEKKISRCDIDIYRDGEWERRIKVRSPGKYSCTTSTYEGYYEYRPSTKYYKDVVLREKLQSSLNQKELECLTIQLGEVRESLTKQTVKSFLEDVEVSYLRIELVTDREGLKKLEDLPYGIRIFADSILEVSVAVDAGGNCLYMSSAKLEEDLKTFSDQKEVREAIEKKKSRNKIKETLKEIEDSLK